MPRVDEKKEYLEHYIRKYSKYSIEAEKKYQEHLENYKSFKELATKGFNNGELLLGKYIRIAIKDLKDLGILDITETDFINKYLRNYTFKYNFNKIQESYNDICKYKKELEDNVSNNHNPSSVKFYPKNISSISTSIGLNILANTGYVFSIAKDRFKIERYINSEMQNLLNQIKKSNILAESFSESVFYIFRAFFACIEDKLKIKINFVYSDTEIKNGLLDILKSRDNQIAIENCIKEIKIKAKSRNKVIKKREKIESIIMTIVILTIAIMFTLIISYKYNTL